MTDAMFAIGMMQWNSVTRESIHIVPGVSIRSYVPLTGAALQAVATNSVKTTASISSD
jgi:hypothetical protein